MAGGLQPPPAGPYRSRRRPSSSPPCHVSPKSSGSLETMLVAMGKFGLEAFKMALYVAAPVVVTVMIVADRDTLVRVIKERSYVVFNV